MNDELVVAVSNAVGILSILPGTPADIETVTKAWFMVAKEDHLTPADVERATRTLIRSKFFPRPGEFAEAARPVLAQKPHRAALPAGPPPPISDEVREMFRRLKAKFCIRSVAEEDFEAKRELLRRQAEELLRKESA